MASVHSYGTGGIGAHTELVGWVLVGPFGRRRFFDERPTEAKGWRLYRRVRPSYGPAHEFHTIAVNVGGGKS
jgi:hypothetical protein